MLVMVVLTNKEIEIITKEIIKKIIKKIKIKLKFSQNFIIKFKNWIII